MCIVYKKITEEDALRDVRNVMMMTHVSNCIILCWIIRLDIL